MEQDSDGEDLLNRLRQQLMLFRRSKVHYRRADVAALPPIFWTRHSLMPTFISEPDASS